MAVTFLNTNTPQEQLTSSPYSKSFAVNVGGANVVAFAVVTWGQTAGQSIGTPTYGGQSMSPCGSVVQSGSNAYTQVFFIANPLTGSQTLTFTFSGGISVVMANVIAFQGVHQTTPVRVGTYKTLIGINTAVSLTVPSASTDLTFSAINTSNIVLSSTNQTSDGILNDATNVNSLGSDHATNAALLVTHTWTFASTSHYALLGFSIQAAVSVAFVSAGSGKVAAGASFTISLSPAAGNTLVLGIALDNNTLKVLSITDNGAGGGSLYYHRIDDTAGSPVRTELWTTLPGGVASGVTTITVTLSSSCNAVAAASEYSGVHNFGLANRFFNSSVSTPSFADSIIEANDFLVAVFGGAGNATFSASTGNLRTSNTVSTTAGVGINDNTVSTGLTTVTNTVSMSGAENFTSLDIELKAGAPPNGISTLVQGTIAQTSGSSTTASLGLALAKPVAVGDALVVFARTGDTATTISLSDTLGGSWNALASITLGTQMLLAWYSIAQSAGACTVLASPSGGTNIYIAYASHYQGPMAFNEIVSTSGTVGGTEVTTPSITTSSPNENLVGVGATSSSIDIVNNPADNGWAYEVYTFSNLHSMSEDKQVTAVGSYAATFPPMFSGQAFAAVMLSFISQPDIVVEYESLPQKVMTSGRSVKIFS